MRNKLIRIILKWISHFHLKIRYPFERNYVFVNCIFLFNTIRSSHSNAITLMDGMVYKSKIKIIGKHNCVSIKGQLNRSTLEIIGNGNVINLADNTKILSGKIFIKGDNLNFTIGSNSTSTKGTFIVMGNNNHLKIGEECMLAEGTDMWATDSHPIFKTSDLSMPVNKSLPIDVGNHVWTGKNSVILKGVTIGDNAIVGMNSVVTKDVPNDTIVAGNPAKHVKYGFTWKREHIKI